MEVIVYVLCDTPPPQPAFDKLKEVNAPRARFEVCHVDGSFKEFRAHVRHFVAMANKDVSHGKEVVFHCCFRDSEKQGAATRLLDLWNMPYTGCRSIKYTFDAEDLIMMCCYSEVPMQPFSVLDAQHKTKDLEQLSYIELPVEASDVDLWHEEGTSMMTSAEVAHDFVVHMMERHPRVLVRHRAEDRLGFCKLYVAAFGREANSLWCDTDACEEHRAVLLEKIAPALAQHVLDHNGSLVAHLVLEMDPTPQKSGQVIPVLHHVRMGFSWWDVVDSPKLDALVTASVAQAKTLYAKQAPRYRVAFDAQTKGYHLRASRDIRKGDIVFEDEGRSFAIVTKEHVRATWSEEDKTTFTRYAWPLDGDGHVYAIWEEHPKRWRPINHACDPNCINAAPHSLNVVAARDILEGDDLTIDYATFCDYTMKSFTCHCGSSQCRGVIVPDEASLAKYGKNTWHRKHPDPEGGL